jgi:hypothetical protein
VRLNRAKWYMARRNKDSTEVFYGPLDTKRECWDYFAISPWGTAFYRGVQIEDDRIEDRRKEFSGSKSVPVADWLLHSGNSVQQQD